MTGISRRTLGDLVTERLKTLPHVEVFPGEVPDSPPLIGDGTDRVAPYVLLYTGAGNPTIEQALAEASVELDWSFQTTCVAGYQADCEDLVDRVHDLLFRWRPVLENHAFGLVKPPPGFDPGTIRRSNQPGVPPRFSLPLLWRLEATTS